MDNMVTIFGCMLGGILGVLISIDKNLKASNDLQELIYKKLDK